MHVHILKGIEHLTYTAVICVFGSVHKIYTQCLFLANGTYGKPSHEMINVFKISQNADINMQIRVNPVLSQLIRAVFSSRLILTW